MHSYPFSRREVQSAVELSAAAETLRPGATAGPAQINSLLRRPTNDHCEAAKMLGFVARSGQAHAGPAGWRAIRKVAMELPMVPSRVIP
jgi:hypothetical protein